MKTKLLFIAILMHSAISYALMPPPVNDDPCGATQLTVSNFCEITPFTCTGATVSAGYGNCGYAYPNNDVWFKVTVPASGKLTINSTGELDSYWGSYPAAFMGVYSGSNCNSLTVINDCLHSNDFSILPSLSLTGRTPGETLWIRFWTFDPAAQCGICVAEPSAHPACGTGNLIAGNTACTATPVCNLNGYCTNTSSSFTVDTWPELTQAFEDFQETYPQNRSIDNNSFIKFIALSSTVSLNVWNYNCVGNNSGIQFLVFGATNCGSGAVIPYCFRYFQPNEQGFISLMGLTPGNTYYIMFDGINGDICDVVLSVLDANTGVTVNPSDTTVCLGQPVSLKASGGNGTYNWSPSAGLSSATGANVVASNSSLGTLAYVVTSQSGNPLCPTSNTDTARINVINCGTSVVASNSGPVCPSSNFNLMSSNVAGSITYAWTGPNGFTSNVQNPTNNTAPSSPGSYTYTVVVSTATETATASTTLIVNPVPTISASASPNSICTGKTSVLTASGANTYIWTPGGAGNSITVSPTSTMVYNVVGTNASGCSASNSVTVTVNQIPAVSALASPSTICSGKSSILTGSGANTYSWTPGGAGSPITVAPTTTTVYNVTGTSSAGCTASNSVTVTVNLNPILNITATPNVICDGGSATLIGSGASTYDWNPGAMTGSSITVSPIQTTTYSVTGSSTLGCVSTSNIIIKVDSVPVVAAIANPDSVCVGQSAVLTGYGASTYTWTPGSLSGSTVTVTPASTISYNVIGTSSGGCTASASVVVNVIPIPTADAGVDQTICEGFSATLTSSTQGVSYLWSENNQTTQSITVNPIASPTIYTLTVNDGTCSNIANVVVTMVPLANAGPDHTICKGESALLVGSGYNSITTTYQWNTSPVQNAASVSVSPIDTTNYVLTVTNSYCQSTDTTKVFVKPLPLASAGSDLDICIGGVANPIASGGGTYMWSASLGTNAMISVSPSATNHYTVTVTLNGCSASDEMIVDVNSLPVITMTSKSETCDMINGSAMASATGGSGIFEYIWNTGDTTASIVNIAHGPYSVIINDSITGCIATDSVYVNHILGPDAYFLISNQTPLIDEEIVNFTDHSTGSIVSWSWSLEGISSSESQNFDYVFNTVGIVPVSLTVVDTNGCSDTYIDKLITHDNPTFYIPNAFTPNGDADNPGFGPESFAVNPQDYQMIIFNRWGHVMFSTNRIEEKWNGTKDNKGNFTDAVEDVYVYEIKVRDVNNNIKKYIGKLTLIK